MLGDPIGIFSWGVFAESFSIRIDHADLAIVEIDLVILIYQTDRVGAMRVDIAQDQVQVGLVASTISLNSFRLNWAKSIAQ